MQGTKRLAPDHKAVLQAAVERFFEAHGRWPRSMEELDPFGIRGFGHSLVVGFGDAYCDELCLRYVHRRGKAVVRVRRPSGVSPTG